MNENSYLRELIESKNAAILCRSEDEIEALAKLVDTLFTGYGQRVLDHRSWLGSTKYMDGMCIRLDQIGKYSLDYGHSTKEWYEGKGRRVIALSDILLGGSSLDLGEIASDEADFEALLFGL